MIRLLHYRKLLEVAATKRGCPVALVCGEATRVDVIGQHLWGMRGAQRCMLHRYHRVYSKLPETALLQGVTNHKIEHMGNLQKRRLW